MARGGWEPPNVTRVGSPYYRAAAGVERISWIWGREDRQKQVVHPSPQRFKAGLGPACHVVGRR